MPLSSKSFRVSSQNRKIQDVPNVPVIGTPVVSVREDRSIDIPFTVPTPVTGGIPALYRAISTPGNFEGVSRGSPVTVSGLTGGTSYTFQVRAETSTGANNGLTAPSSTIVPQFGAMESIATVSNSSGSLFFSNIPQNYQDLFISVQMRGVNAGTDEFMIAQINGSSTGHSWTALGGDGASTFSNRNSPGGIAPAYFYVGLMPGGNSTAGLFATANINILNYSNTSTNKSVLWRFVADRNGSGQTTASSALFASNTAVSSISIIGSNGTNGTATLYGIRASI
jgi:hypothetical protein